MSANSSGVFVDSAVHGTHFVCPEGRRKLTTHSILINSTTLGKHKKPTLMGGCTKSPVRDSNGFRLEGAAVVQVLDVNTPPSINIMETPSACAWKFEGASCMYLADRMPTTTEETTALAAEPCHRLDVHRIIISTCSS